MKYAMLSAILSQKIVLEGSFSSIPYSLNFSRVKIFVDFWSAHEYFSLENFVLQCSTSAIHEKFIHETDKFTIP